MKLFEITNGWMGQSYCRAYAWAPDCETALQLARVKFEAEARANGYNSAYWTELQAEELMDATALPFCTVPNGDGWLINK